MQIQSKSDNFDFDEFDAAIGPEIDVPGFDDMALDDAFYEVTIKSNSSKNLFPGNW